jgi:hypothetical protein
MRHVLRLFILLCVAFPLVASAQAYVPVIDINMEEVFPDIMRDAEDSLRNIIAGPQPGGVAIEECQIGNSVDVVGAAIFGYEEGPWVHAYAAAQNLGLDLPDPGQGGGGSSAYFQANPPQEIISNSLRCLLEQQVEFQKLQLNLQIHDMLREYIADAQNYLLTKQLSAHIAAANTEYIKTGQETCTTDQLGNEVCTHRSLGNSDEEDAVRERTGNQVQNVVDRITNDDTNPQGNYGMCAPNKLFVARTVLQNQRGNIEDSAGYVRESTNCISDTVSGGPNAPFNAQGDADAFFGGGGMQTDLPNGSEIALWDAINNPSMSPLGSLSQMDNFVDEQAAQEKASQEKKIAQGNGYLPDEQCSATPEDPRCIERTTVSQGNLTAEFTQKYSAQGDTAIMNSNSLDQQVGPQSQQQSSRVVQGGFENYETQALQQTDVTDPYRALVTEFHDVINFGYWGTNQGTNNWADATMLMIYDTMADRELPEVAMPTGQTGNRSVPITP